MHEERQPIHTQLHSFYEEAYFYAVIRAIPSMVYDQAANGIGDNPLEGLNNEEGILDAVERGLE